MNTATERVTKEAVLLDAPRLAPCPRCGSLCVDNSVPGPDVCPACGIDGPVRVPGPDKTEAWIFFDRLAEDVRLGLVSPAWALFRAVARAEHWIHYVVEGMDSGVVGLLQDAVRSGVGVRGVAGPTSVVEPRLSAGKDLLGGTALVVVDGLVAFRGPGILSCSVWGVAGRFPGRVSASSDPAEIAEWNDRLFSPLWMEQQGNPAFAERIGVRG